MSDEKSPYIVVPFDRLEDDEFVYPAVYYFQPATGDLVFVKAKDRPKAQELCDEWTGEKGKYTIRAIKDVKSKSKMESGELSVRGSNTRKCFAPRLKGLK